MKTYVVRKRANKNGYMCEVLVEGKRIYSVIRDHWQYALDEIFRFILLCEEEDDDRGDNSTD